MDENLNEKVAVLEEWKTNNVIPFMETVIKDIKDIKDNLLKRPSWATLAIITFLSSTTIGLLVAFLSKLGNK